MGAGFSAQEPSLDWMPEFWDRVLTLPVPQACRTMALRWAISPVSPRIWHPKSGWFLMIFWTCPCCPCHRNGSPFSFWSSNLDAFLDILLAFEAPRWFLAPDLCRIGWPSTTSGRPWGIGQEPRSPSAAERHRHLFILHIILHFASFAISSHFHPIFIPFSSHFHPIFCAPSGSSMPLMPSRSYRFLWCAPWNSWSSSTRWVTPRWTSPKRPATIRKSVARPAPDAPGWWWT